MPPNTDQVNQNKLAARQCLVAADKYIKEGHFVEARKEIEKAKSLDPSNVYVGAFIDRINFFEKERKLEAGTSAKAHESKAAQAVPKQSVSHAVSAPSIQPTKVNEISFTTEQSPKIVPTVPAAQPASMTEHTPEAFPKAAAAVSMPKISPPVEQRREPDEQNIPSSGSIRNSQTERSYTESQLAEMKKQIELLSQALEQEKKAREEMKKNQVQQSVAQLRAALEKAWINGAPQPVASEELHTLAVSLSIPENVEKTIQREVKVEMYSKAVKEVVSKRQLLRSSSSTLEWLRKVYQLTLEEYLEYESKFLMDLVSNQYKGTLFQISSDETTKSEIASKLKLMGYAVVVSPSPEHALEKIEKLNPNVIVCETSFDAGSLSGIKFLHILRNSSKFNFIPFVLLAGKDDLSLIETSDLRPNEGIIKKPVNIDELSAMINEKLVWFREYISSLT
ncbi:MAG: hypothetical protein WCT99_02345 [Bacteroidota bacterium]